MIPSDEQCVALWETYGLPKAKQTHSKLVCRVAVFLAKRISHNIGIPINIALLSAAALLHDIDKAIPKRINEHHPDTGVRLLREAGMDEVADVVKTHSLSAIRDQTISPASWEAKLLFLADKMVKYEILDVDRRFALWRDESLPKEAIDELNVTYPLVKDLERKIFSIARVSSGDIAVLA